jgi:MYXO-CTERM domain-containing protein
VTLPDTPCEACTLQLMQVMEDGEFGPGISDLYFQCADIVIEGASAETADPTTGADGTGGEDSSGGGASSGGGDVGSGDAGSSEGSSGGSQNDEGTTSGATTGTDTTGPADSDDGEGGCSCRAAASPTVAAPWLLVALMAWRRRRG